MTANQYREIIDFFVQFWGNDVEIWVSVFFASLGLRHIIWIIENKLTGMKITVKINGETHDEFYSTSEYKTGQCFTATIFRNKKIEDVVCKITSIDQARNQIVLNCKTLEK